MEAMGYKPPTLSAIEQAINICDTPSNRDTTSTALKYLPVAMCPVGEVAFVQGLAAASASGIDGPSKAAAAIIGHADLKLWAHVAPVLDALQAAQPQPGSGDPGPRHPEVPRSCLQTGSARTS